VAVSGVAPGLGSTSQFIAAATFSDGSTQAVTNLAAWQSSNAGVLSVSASGLVTALAAGDADVTATYQSTKGSVHLSIAVRTYGLVGTIMDENTRSPLTDVRVEALNGANAGKVASTDASGTYTFSSLVAETFRLRASKDGYVWGEQNVTVPDIPRADFFLHQSCGVSVSPESYSAINMPFGLGGFTLTATSSSCPWTVTTTDDWIGLTGPRSGMGSSTIPFTLVPNMPVTASRTGSILLSWPGSSARLLVEERPAACTPSTTITVPPSTRGYMFDFAYGCIFNTTITADVPWIHLGSGTHGGGEYKDVLFDPNPGAPRVGHVTVDGHGNGLYEQYTFVQ
jgi:hypothetical protein